MVPPHSISKATIKRPSVCIARPRRWILTFHRHLFLCWHKCTSKWESPIKLSRNVKKPFQFSDAIPQSCQYWDMYAVSGRRREAQSIAAELEGLWKRRYFSPVDGALV